MKTQNIKEINIHQYNLQVSMAVIASFGTTMYTPLTIIDDENSS